MTLSVIRGSDGTGEAIRAVVTVARTAGSTVINVDSLSHWSTNFIATSGSLLGDGSLDPATTLVFRGHKSGSQIIIDEIAPGYVDVGNTIGQVVVIKPATMWADSLVDTLGVSLNDDGTLKAVTQNPGYTAITGTPSLVATNGNRSFDISIPGDQTSALSKGMKLKIARTGTTPTQSADFNGTTQYASKTSPTGISFTDDWTMEAQVYPDSFGTGSEIFNKRLNATAGFFLYVDPAGSVIVGGYNGANKRQWASDTSIGSNQWTHIAATIDISANTCNIYFDGKLVTSTLTSVGTMTAISQAGDIAIGRHSNSALEYFDGRVSDVRLWNVVRTQAQIRDNMNQQLVGNETNLIGYWKLAGNFNDSTSNANNLTPFASAVATYADNPFNANAYAIVMNTPVFSAGNTTATVQSPAGYPIPNQTLGIASYSSVQVPYNFPTSTDMLVAQMEGFWQTWTPTFTGISGGIIAYARWTQIGKTVHWRVRYDMTGTNVSGAATMTMPMPIASDYASPGFIGSGWGRATSGAGFSQMAVTNATGTPSTANLWSMGVTGTRITVVALSAASPAAWAATGGFELAGFYETI